MKFFHELSVFPSLAAQALALEDPAPILARVREEDVVSSSSDDFYHDELGRVVFTAAYHLKRGSCCENGCRHCPYRDGQKGLRSPPP